jgi:hypothetical protein
VLVWVRYWRIILGISDKLLESLGDAS